MPMLKIYRYISTLLISLTAATALSQTTEENIAEKAKALPDTLTTAQKEKKSAFISGAAVSVDMCGLMMKLMNSRFANMEASARLNFKEKYFPSFRRKKRL